MLLVHPRKLVDKVHPAARAALEEVVGIAGHHGFEEIGSAHWLWQLLQREETGAFQMLRCLGVDLEAACAQLRGQFVFAPRRTSERPVFAQPLFDWIRDAWAHASIEREDRTIHSSELCALWIARPDRYGGVELPAFGELDGEGLEARIGDFLDGPPDTRPSLHERVLDLERRVALLDGDPRD